jgi:hypothetical protein
MTTTQHQRLSTRRRSRMKRQSRQNHCPCYCVRCVNCHLINTLITRFKRTVLDAARRRPRRGRRRGRVGLTAARHRQTGTRAAAAGPPQGVGGGIADTRLGRDCGQLTHDCGSSSMSSSIHLPCIDHRPRSAVGVAPRRAPCADPPAVVLVQTPSAIVVSPCPLSADRCGCHACQTESRNRSKRVRKSRGSSRP